MIENMDNNGQQQDSEYRRWLADEEAQREYRDWLDKTYCPVEFQKGPLRSPCNTHDEKERKNVKFDCE